MNKGRPKFGFFIFDCPSDHEIDSSLPTESEVIRAVLVNRKLGSRIKPPVRCSTIDSFKSAKERQYEGIKFVHIGGHGSRTALGFVGGWLKWSDVAAKLITLFPKLHGNEQRVLTLSCCYSEYGIASMKSTLRGHFSAAYHFVPPKIGFSKAITTWSMFYLKKRLNDPHEAIKEDINSFMGKKVLRFVSI